ncbi:MAG: CSLREA domain-containing protein [Myxococcales bacterium]|nr:CSLREA domain-containing protein [Myxococcales bacterium]
MRIIGFAILFVAALILIPRVHAATFTVTKTADTADGVCDADCSLREAVIAANDDSNPDTIVVPAGTYDLTIAGAGEDAGATGDLDIRGPVTIQGADAASTIVDAGGIDRVFHVESGSTRVVFADLTIRGGSAAGSGVDRQGGGIYAFRSLVTILNSVVTGNTAEFRAGGIEVSLGGGDQGGGDLQLLGSTVSMNTAMATGGGGGILTSGRVTVRVSHSTLSGNTSTNGPGGGASFSGPLDLAVVASDFTGNSAKNGGGFTSNQAFAVLVRDVTVENNTAANGGGGVDLIQQGNQVFRFEASKVRGNMAQSGGGIRCDGGVIEYVDGEISGNTATSIGGAFNVIRTNLDIRGSTIKNNQAAAYAGGITVAFGTHVIENSTLTGNSVTSTTGNNGVIGGAAVATNPSTTSNVTIVNSTVADNVAPAGGSQLFCGACAENSVFALRNTIITGPPGVPLCAVRFSSGPFVSEGGNLSDDASCNFNDPTDQQNVADMMLDALQNDGGPTETLPLLSGSPAIGAAVPANCPTHDQRGFQRDGDCDAGAYEANVSFEGFGCPLDQAGASTTLGYVVEEVLPNVDVGDVVFCLGGIAGAA